MSQTGFPNGGIMPDDTPTEFYSELIKSEADIKEIANAVISQAYNPDIIDPKYSFNIATEINGVVTAGLMLAQYYVQQRTYQGNDGYGSFANPAVTNFTEDTSTAFLRSLGSNPDNKSLYNSFVSSSKPYAIGNIYGGLKYGQNAFSWTPEGNLRLFDSYTFTSISDFGLTGSNFIVNLIGTSIGGTIFAPLGVEKYIQDLLAKGLISLNNVRFLSGLLSWLSVPDKVEPYFYQDADSSVIGYKLTIGALETMYIKTEWTPQQIYNKNPALFWNAIRAGLIPLSALYTITNLLCDPVQVGSGPNTLLPNYGSVATDCGSNPNSWTFGGGGNYPKPFTSFAQRTVEAANLLGPFAKFGNLSGRIIVLGTITPNTNYSGELGFIIQSWAEADIGNVLYAQNNELPKNEWFEQTNKTKLRVRFAHFPGEPFIDVQVATGSYAVGNSSLYIPDITIPVSATLLLGTLILAAALL